MDFSQDEKDEFVVEGQELLDRAESHLLAIEQGGEFAQHYDEIFRALHSIKGAAGMMELEALKAHMHQLENDFTELKGRASVEKDQITYFLRGTDNARRLLRGEAPVAAPQAAAPPEQAGPAPSQPVSTISSPSPDGTPAVGRVVFVDDEPLIVEMVTRILEEAGFKTSSTANPLEVEQLIESTSPDVVLADVMMPQMNGLQLVETLRQRWPFLPVVFLSGHVDKEVLLEAMRNGVYGIIEKPFEQHNLIETITNASQRYRLEKLLDGSVNLLMYQFSDLDRFLESQGKEDERTLIRREIEALLQQRKLLRDLNTKGPRYVRPQ